MSDVLERIRRELQQRLESTRAAAQEHERVRAALEALERAVAPVEKVARRAAGGATAAKRSSGGRRRSVGAHTGSATTVSASSAAPAAGSRTSTARSPKAAASTAKARRTAKAGGARSSTTKPAGARAPRGANREAVLTVVRERPGVTAGELTVASGVRGGTLYSLLGRLTAAGVLAKRELPGGRTGYALASSDAPVTAAADNPTMREDRSPHTDDAATAQEPPAERP